MTDIPQLTNAGFSIDELPEWAQKVMREAKPVASAMAPQIAEYRHGAAWPALVNAATVSSFLPRNLVVGKDVEEESRDAERTVLRFAEEVHSPDGTKWSLTRDARKSVLDAATPEDIEGALNRTESLFSDPVSVALREQLAAKPASVESGSLPMLEARRVAATWLQGVDVTKQPVDLDELGREITLRRLLRPFRRMVGDENGDGAQVDPKKVRFFGRDKEVGNLREYVGVVPPTSFGGSVSRLASRVGQAILGARPLFISGIGGVGKTTLIGKFVLEHAEIARSRYPFAYLDFDRATLTARRPELLLAEMCAQVGAQFADLTQPMRTLQDMARALSLAPDAATERAPPNSFTLEELHKYLPEGSRDITAFAQLLPLLSEFREAVDSHIASLESVFELKRPFLLIFDTFELVQYSDIDVRRIEDFVRVLSRSRNGLGWPRLRLIVSGRKTPTKFFDRPLAKDEVITLGVLDRNGSIKMLQALASDAGQPIGPKEAELLVDAMIVGLLTAKTEGLHPLTLKLLGTVFANAGNGADSTMVSELVVELRDNKTKDARLRKAMIDGILIRRILEHVSDKRVRALADPGLVVRRITPDVIREVMARGTPRPGSETDVIDDDSLDFQPWQLSAAEANSIFDAFRHEVSLVESDEIGLRHRQDLRQEMLPLIKLRHPNRFKFLHSLAFQFFRQQAQSNQGGDPSRAEAIYHGLWLGESLEEIDPIWPEKPGFDARLDPDEFEDMPVARRYLRAKSRQTLSIEEVSGLPHSVAMNWLISRQDAFLDDDYPNEVARVTLIAAGDEYSDLDHHVQTAAIIARLLYRTGQWADSERLIARHKIVDFFRGSSSDQDRLSLLRTWVTMSAKLGADPMPLEIARLLGEMDRRPLEPFVRTELLSFAALGNRILKGQGRSGWDDDIRARVTGGVAVAARQVGPALWQRHQRALRFAILASEGGVADLQATYLDLGGFPSREEGAYPIIAQLLARALREVDSKTASEIEARDFERSSARDADFLSSAWNSSRRWIVQSLDSPAQQQRLRMILAFDHYDWIRPLGNALSRAFEGERGLALRDALVNQQFLADLGSPPAGLDGLSLCQWAEAGGRLLQLAGTIDDFSEEFSSDADDESQSYPETAFGIAEALLQWHEVILDSIGDIEEEPEETVPRAPKKKKKAASTVKRRPPKAKRKKK